VFLSTLSQSSNSTTVIYQSALNTTYMGFNNRLPPFNDRLVRRAIALGLDRQRLLAPILTDNATLANQFLPPSLELGYTPGLNWLDHNPKDANELLAQSGFDKNQEITLIYPYNPPPAAPEVESLARSIQSQLQALGLNVSIQSLDSAAYRQALQSGSAQMFLATWNATYPDPDDFFSQVFITDSTAFGAPYPDLVDLIRRASQNPSTSERQALYDRINEMLLDIVPAIPLAHTSGIYAFSNTVQGQRLGPVNENFEEMRSSNGQIRITQVREPSSLWPANDVATSLIALWDEKDVNHTGRTGRFEIFQRFFGAFASGTLR
jgi:peptide/nickel transport system substrate-binding protein